MYYKVCIHNLLCPLPGVYVFDLEQIFPIPEQDLCVLFIICNSWMNIMNLVVARLLPSW